MGTCVRLGEGSEMTSVSHRLFGSDPHESKAGQSYNQSMDTDTDLHSQSPTREPNVERALPQDLERFVALERSPARPSLKAPQDGQTLVGDHFRFLVCKGNAHKTALRRHLLSMYLSVGKRSSPCDITRWETHTVKRHKR